MAATWLKPIFLTTTKQARTNQAINSLELLNYILIQRKTPNWVSLDAAPPCKMGVKLPLKILTLRRGRHLSIMLELGKLLQVILIVDLVYLQYYLKQIDKNSYIKH
jgi:hypothetical protein